MDPKTIKEAVKYGVKFKDEFSKELSNYIGARELIGDINRFLVENDLEDAYIEAKVEQDYSDNYAKIIISGSKDRNTDKVKEEIKFAKQKVKQAAQEKTNKEMELYQKLHQKYGGCSLVTIPKPRS